MILGKTRDLYVEFLDKKLFPFLVLNRNQHFDPRTDLDFCYEFLIHVITFAEQVEKENLDFYLFSIVNSQPFFEFIKYISLDEFLIKRAFFLLEKNQTREKKETPSLFSPKFSLLLNSFLNKFKILVLLK